MSGASRTTNLFGGPNSDQYNAIRRAIDDCGSEWSGGGDFVTNCPITSMSVHVVDKLIENGFKIVKESR